MVSLGFIALKYPLAAALIVLVGVVLMAIFAGWIFRALRRRWRRPVAAYSAKATARPARAGAEPRRQPRGLDLYHRRS